MSADPRPAVAAALETLAAQGAEGDALVETGRTLRLVMRGGILEEIQRAETRGLGVRAIVEGRLGFGHTAEAGPDAAAAAARRAVELARFATAREDLALAPPSGPGDGRDEGEPLGILDASVEGRSVEEKSAWLHEVEKSALAVDPRVSRIQECSYQESSTSRWLGNTRGSWRHFRRTNVQAGIEVMAAEGDQQQTGDRRHEGTSWASLPAPAAFGREASERALRLLGGQPVESGRYPVVFSPEAGFAPLLYLVAALRGDHLARKRSWLADRTHPTLGSAEVTVRDEARLVAGVASVPWDAEGTDTLDLVLVEAGEVKDRLLDLASARRLGLPANGRAVRAGYDVLPEVGALNVSLAPGAHSPDDIVASTGRGLWVWGLTGWWIGLDPSNPNFSSAAYGLWIEGGKPVRPVARVTLAGTIADLLGGVDAVGNDLRRDAPTTTPTYRVAELSVSGS